MNATYLYSLDGSQPISKLIESSATVVPGDLGAMTNGEVGLLTAADTAIAGIIQGSGDDGDMVQVLLLNQNSVIRISYTGSVKTSLAKADLMGKTFDWDATSKKLNLDDITDGVFKVVDYDNTAGTADVIISAAKLWNA